MWNSTKRPPTCAGNGGYNSTRPVGLHPSPEVGLKANLSAIRAKGFWITPYTRIVWSCEPAYRSHQPSISIFHFPKSPIRHGRNSFGEPASAGGKYSGTVV